MAISDFRRSELQEMLEMHQQMFIGAVDEPPPDIQEGVEFTLLQMKREIRRKLEDALARLGRDEYGYCADCKREINEERLRALPFAARCRYCENAKEEADLRRQRQIVPRRGASPRLFMDD